MNSLNVTCANTRISQYTNEGGEDDGGEWVYDGRRRQIIPHPVVPATRWEWEESGQGDELATLGFDYQLFYLDHAAVLQMKCQVR